MSEEKNNEIKRKEGKNKLKEKENFKNENMDKSENQVSMQSEIKGIILINM